MPRNLTAWESDFYARVGSRLHHFRIQRGYGLARLGREVGTSESTIRNIERGLQSVTLGLLWRAAAVLDVPLENFIPRRAQLGQPDLPVTRAARHPDVRGRD